MRCPVCAIDFLLGWDYWLHVRRCRNGRGRGAVDSSNNAAGRATNGDGANGHRANGSDHEQWYWPSSITKPGDPTDQK